ncbi:hypothetical protein DY000_02038042 [Brassica cretica]|uniref:Putative plant transposon protein domain-containing protein n=1 Tax=Brassica cretica TaxID=69181 RepID=A0ABQ7BQJ3_BRACR|nr:hypothetical protein DY000_02038042 [Brassica cretica]
MVRMKKMAKRDIAVTSWTHAEGVVQQSDDQHASSACEEVQIDKVTATSSDPAPPNPLSDPFETAPSESLRSETSDPVTNSLLLLRHEEKEGSVEGLKEQSKDNPEPFEKIQEDAQTEGRRKTSKLGAPNAASGSPVVTQNTSVSSRVRSRKAPERGTAVEVSPVTKRVDQFLHRNIIDERLVDMTEKDQWGYVEIIEKGSMGTTVSSLDNYVEPVMFYAGLPVTKVEADAEEVEVQVRDHVYQFSSTMINDVLNLESLNEDEVEEETALDAISKSELAEFLTEGTRKEWDNLTTTDLSPRYGALMIITAHNWIPSTYKTHVSIGTTLLVYKMARGIRIDIGRLIFKQVMNLGVVQKNDSRCMIVPRLIMSILQKQHRVLLHSGEKAQGPVVYTKGNRVGEIYE